jgi:hypothetical protein
MFSKTVCGQMGFSSLSVVGHISLAVVVLSSVLV